MFLLGFLPTCLIMRGKLWRLKRRLARSEERQRRPGRRPRRRRRSPPRTACEQPDLRRHRHARPGPRPRARQGGRGIAGGLKLGPRILRRQRPRRASAELADLGLPIFLDLKLHDIPNTVAKAVQALRPLEPAILTVHAAGGRAMLEDAKAAAPARPRSSRSPSSPASTRATSPRPASTATRHDQVERLAALAAIVRPRRHRLLGRGSRRRPRKAWPDGFFVVPGVRPARRRRGRPEAGRHAARGDGRRRVDPGHRPADHRRRRSRRGAPRHRGDAVEWTSVAGR